MRPRRAGFTLIEMLIALSIIAIVTGSIVACLNGGIRIWERAKTYGLEEVDLSFASELLAQDLANAIPWEGKPLRGLAEQCAFPCLARSAPGSPLAPHWIRYRVLGGAPAELFREVATLDSPDLPIDRERLLSFDGDLAFRYSDTPRVPGDLLAGAGEWSHATNFPLFVFVTLRGADASAWQIARELRMPLALVPRGEVRP